MQWSGQQEQAIKAVQEWLKDDSNKLFYLAGYAGTGKTTLAKEIASGVSRVLYGAFTGKAASVMRRKGCARASTIHSMIYAIEDDTVEQPQFVLNRESEVRDAKLVIIDECSMIDEVMSKDLMSFGTKILVIGDPAQLPPISGAGFFTGGEPNIMLTEIHRQAQDNPIINMSMKIRQGGKLDFGTYGTSRVITTEELQSEDVTSADQVIVGLNSTRHLYNQRIRSLLGHQTDTPIRGEKLVCLKNDRQAGVLNGTQWKVDTFKHLKHNILKMTITPADDEEEYFGKPKVVRVRNEFFFGNEKEIPWQEKKGTQEFTYGYALTCHKSQGSQYNNVVVFDESAKFRDQARAWAYTALTRAAERITWVQQK